MPPLLPLPEGPGSTLSRVPGSPPGPCKAEPSPAEPGLRDAAALSRETTDSERPSE